MVDLYRLMASLAVLGWLLVAGPQLSPAHGADLSGLAERSLSGHIRPGYGAFLERARDLEGAIAAHCAGAPRSGGDGGGEAVATAFREAVLAWSRVEHLRFGPAVRGNRHERIAFWPDAKGIARRQVARAMATADNSLTEPGALAAKSVALQGLTAFELVLYGAGASGVAGTGPTGAGAPASIHLEAEGYRCRYARAIAGNVAEIAGAIVAEWAEDGDFARLWLTAGEANPVYLNASEIALELSRAYDYGLQALRELKLVAPLGLQRPRRQPTMPPYDLSGLSVPVIAANTEAIASLIADGGLLELVEAAAPGAGKAITGELERVIELAGEVRALGRAAFRNDPDRRRLISMGFPLKTAIQLGGEEIKAAAGLAIGFNASDGD